MKTKKIGGIFFISSLSLIGCANNLTEETRENSCRDRTTYSIKSLTPSIEDNYQYIIYIDNSFSGERQNLIQEGARQWEDKANNLLLSFQIADLQLIHRVQYTDGTIVVINQDPGNNYSGWTSWGDKHAYMLIPNKYENKYFLATATHEFGHAFHLLDDPRHYYSIMWQGYNITCDDLDQFCSKWQCKDSIVCCF